MKPVSWIDSALQKQLSNDRGFKVITSGCYILSAWLPKPKTGVWTERLIFPARLRQFSSPTSKLFCHLFLITVEDKYPKIWGLA